VSSALFGIGLASLLLVPVLSGFALAELREYRRQRVRLVVHHQDPRLVHHGSPSPIGSTTRKQVLPGRLSTSIEPPRKVACQRSLARTRRPDDQDSFHAGTTLPHLHTPSAVAPAHDAWDA
jgi:hypothetical protein